MSGRVPQQRQARTTRRPTGLPHWPILLIAGCEKSGKSWSCAEASGSDLIGRTLWIGTGEDDPDEYGPNPATGKGGVPGADFEIVPHDGSYRDILAAVDWACHEPPVDGKPVLVVVDSMTRVWDLLCGMAQDAATKRRDAKLAKAGQAPSPSSAEADITVDLWNTARDRWEHIIDALRAHQGPSLVTARLDEVVVMENGRPTSQRTLKVQAHKSLPYDVGGIVQMPERGKAYLTGVRTTRFEVPKPLPLPSFTVDGLWRKLGLAELEAGVRTHSGVQRQDPLLAQRVLLLNAIRDAVGNDDDRVRQVAAEWAASHEGQPITETTDIGGLELLRDDLARAAEKAGAAA